MDYLIGIDLGTSATKSILMDEKGNIIVQSTYSYPMYQPANGWAEQDPLDWKIAAIRTIKEVVEKSKVPVDNIKGIGLAGQMHGLVMLDEKNELLGRSIIWCDQRTGKQVAKMKKLWSEEKWIDITGNPPLAGWTAAKIMWVQENEPDKYAKCKKILLPKDYIGFILTGKHATDVSDASGMQLLDIKKRCWSQEVLSLLGIDESLLGKVYESNEVVGYLNEEIANLTGLTTKTAVIAGASDNAAAGIGTGTVREGDAFTSIGTSAVIFTHLDQYIKIPDGGIHILCSAVPGCWHTLGGPQSAGLSIEWFKDKFCGDLVQQSKQESKDFYKTLTELVSTIPIGSDKLIYLPFLMGERTPHIDPDYRGAFIGLNVVHTQAHMLRAIMEGIVYCLADCKDILQKEGINVTSMRLCGGGTTSPVWQRIMADLYCCKLFTLDKEEGPSYGAAILAGVGTGVFESIEYACDSFIRESHLIAWDKKEAEVYKKYHEIYDEFYHDLKRNFAKLAAL